MKRFAGLQLIFVALLFCVLQGCNHDAAHISADSGSSESNAMASAREERDREIADLCKIISDASAGPTSSDAIEVASAERLIGDKFSNFADYESARDWYEEAYKHLPARDKDELAAYLAYSITNCDIRLKDSIRTERSMARLKGLLGSRSDSVSLYRLEFSKGLRKYLAGSTVVAARHFSKALYIAERLQSPYTPMLDPMLMLAFHKISAGNPVEAVRMLDYYRPATFGDANLSQKADYMKAYTQGFTLLNMLDSASIYQDHYFILLDSLRKGNEYRVLSRHVNALSTRQKGPDRDGYVTVAVIVALLIILTIVVLTLTSRRARRRNLPASDVAMMRLERHSGDADKSASNPARDSLFLKVREIVERPENFSNPDFTLPTVAEAVGVNVKYVSDSIKEATGYSFRRFVNSYRIGEARRLLLDENILKSLTMQSIAERVGFKSASAFISWFKQFTGMTPSAYVRLSSSGELLKSEK